jgi:hypothetical protein
LRAKRPPNMVEIVAATPMRNGVIWETDDCDRSNAGVDQMKFARRGLPQMCLSTAVSDIQPHALPDCVDHRGTADVRILSDERQLMDFRSCCYYPIELVPVRQG